MTKQFSLETETPIIRMPSWYSYEALVCGRHISGRIILPHADDGSNMQYGVSRLLCKFKAWYPLAFVGLSYDDMRSDMSWVWRREEEVAS
jgi:hypothetical protein